MLEPGSRATTWKIRNNVSYAGSEIFVAGVAMPTTTLVMVILLPRLSFPVPCIRSGLKGLFIDNYRKKDKII